MGCGAGKSSQVQAFEQEVSELKEERNRIVKENEELKKQLAGARQDGGAQDDNGGRVVVESAGDRPADPPGTVQALDEAKGVLPGDPAPCDQPDAQKSLSKTLESVADGDSRRAEEAAATRIQSLQRGKQARKIVSEKKAAKSAVTVDRGLLDTSDVAENSTAEGTDSPAVASALGTNSSINSAQVDARAEGIDGDVREQTPTRTVTPDGSEATEAVSPSAARKRKSCDQCLARAELFQDPSDMCYYCEPCWIDYYGQPPNRGGPPMKLPSKLVPIEKGELWTDDALAERWAAFPIAGWPPPPAVSQHAQVLPGPGLGNEVWSNVRIRVAHDIVGSHARETCRADRPYLNEVLSQRYRIDSVCGCGHFTRALIATDMASGSRVCVKRHNALSVESLTDLLCIGRRLEAVDPRCENFPRLIDAFYDMSGYTVEALIEGNNCLQLMRDGLVDFDDMCNLRYVARGVLRGLTLLAHAGVVHCDVKPDNIMWTGAPGSVPNVRLVDFGCARLDRRLENGRNWSLAEGGAGHLGKWAPEMALRIPITDRTDVWGIAVSLLELHCGRAMWTSEQDTVEVVLAQALGLCNMRQGLPAHLLRRSPLDITKLYSPAPDYFPVRRTHHGDGVYEELRPSSWGLSCVMGSEDSWDESRHDFASFIQAALMVDPEERPSAVQLLSHSFAAQVDSSTSRSRSESDVVEGSAVSPEKADDLGETAPPSAKEAAKTEEGQSQ